MDWWLTRAAALIGAYESHSGFIDHPSHPESGASKRANDPHFRHNVREYNAWAIRNGAGVLELPARLPLIGASMSPITDYLTWARDGCGEIASREVQHRYGLPKFRVAPAGDHPIRRRTKRLEAGDRRAGVSHHRRRLHGLQPRRSSPATITSRSRFVSEPDTGLYDAVVKGFTRATGDVVAYLNAGDIFHEHAFRVASQVMNQEGVDWICGYHLKINEHGEVIAVSKPPRYRREFILNGTYLRGFPYAGIQQEGIFFRRKLLETVDLEALKTIPSGRGLFSLDPARKKHRTAHRA